MLLIDEPGDSKINDLRRRATVGFAYQDVGWLDVAVDNPLLVCVLNGAADCDHQFDALLQGITARNLHGAADFGPPTGKEVW